MLDRGMCGGYSALRGVEKIQCAVHLQLFLAF